jgi:hypothetical protein
MAAAGARRRPEAGLSRIFAATLSLFDPSATTDRKSGASLALSATMSAPARAGVGREKP